MSGCRLADTPIDPNQKLEDDKEGEQKLVGELIYLSNTWSNIAFAVSSVS